MLERLRRHALGLFRQAQKQVLAGYMGLLELTRLLLGQHQHMFGLVGEFLKCHRYLVPAWRQMRRIAGTSPRACLIRQFRHASSLFRVILALLRRECQRNPRTMPFRYIAYIKLVRTGCACVCRFKLLTFVIRSTTPYRRHPPLASARLDGIRLQSRSGNNPHRHPPLALAYVVDRRAPVR